MSDEAERERIARDRYLEMNDNGPEWSAVPPAVREQYLTEADEVIALRKKRSVSKPAMSTDVSLKLSLNDADVVLRLLESDRDCTDNDDVTGPLNRTIPKLRRAVALAKQRNEVAALRSAMCGSKQIDALVKDLRKHRVKRQ